MVVASFVFSERSKFMNYDERLVERKKLDILKSINANLTSINKRLGDIDTTLKVNGFAVIPTVLAEEIENAKETED